MQNEEWWAIKKIDNYKNIYCEIKEMRKEE